MVRPLCRESERWKDVYIDDAGVSMSESPNSVTFKQHGRTAIVTGAGRNIGKAIAIELARQGANVIVNGSRDLAALEQTVKEIEAVGSRGLPYVANVGKPDAVAAMVRHAHDTFGSADIVVATQLSDRISRSSTFRWKIGTGRCRRTSLLVSTLHDRCCR